MIAVMKRELAGYYKGIMGYLFAAFLLIFAGIYTMAYNLSGYYANFEYVLDAISFIYLLAVPIITMRSVAEERKQKTDQLLYSLPLTLTQVVLGKYLAMLVVLLMPCAVLATYPLILRQFGNVALGTAYSTLLAFYLLGAALLSIGLFISAVTENPVASGVICLAAMLLLYFMSGLASYVSNESGASLIALMIMAALFAVLYWFLAKSWAGAILVGLAGCGGLLAWHSLNSSAFEGLFPELMRGISLFDRFSGFVEGMIDLTAVVYYASVIGVFLFMTVQAMEKRRWSE